VDEVALELQLTLRPDAAAAAVGRHVVRGLAPLLDHAVLESTELLVSELVTNSLRHAGSPLPIELQLSVTSHGGVRGEVQDMGKGFREPLAGVPFPGAHATSGWGLYLVENIAQRWGVREDGGTAVWFEIDPPNGHFERRHPELAFGQSPRG
jgi:anti-sigma regulatory factor (Ser/Thr protein kinase)